MDKVHKAFIVDPYILGVHVQIFTNTTLRSGAEVKDDLVHVTLPMGELEVAAQERAEERESGECGVCVAYARTRGRRRSIPAVGFRLGFGV